MQANVSAKGTMRVLLQLLYGPWNNILVEKQPNPFDYFRRFLLSFESLYPKCRGDYRCLHSLATIHRGSIWVRIPLACDLSMCTQCSSSWRFWCRCYEFENQLIRWKECCSERDSRRGSWFGRHVNFRSFLSSRIDSYPRDASTCWKYRLQGHGSYQASMQLMLLCQYRSKYQRVVWYPQ
jgi:hypothetical protein